MAANSPTAGAASKLRFSTDVLPERDRIAIWREEFGRRLGHWEFEPLNHPVHADFTMRAMPSLKLVSAEHSAVRVTRTRQLLADGDDDLVLQISRTGGSVSHLGRDFEVKANDGILSSNSDTGTYILPSAVSKCLLLGLSRQKLRPLLSDFDSVVACPLAADTPALHLLKSYIGVFDDLAMLTPELQHLIVTHVYDLVATALGATGEAMDVANRRGVRAARLRAAKTYILRNLGSHNLSAATVATQLGVTPRYVHTLFETEDESFTEFVLTRRLAHAHRMLSDPRFTALTISVIAIDAGFADLSHFNHSFRRRFGATPSQARKQAAQATDRT